MDRAIIHLNIADFAVAVERVVDRRLKDRPVIIAPKGSVRASVYDMSEEAYQVGVRKRMALPRAVRLCRDAAVLSPHPDRYERAMRAVLKQALPYSPRIEAGDRDGHLFVDVTGSCRLFGPPIDVAWRLSRHVTTDLGLNPIWSVAPNKLMAKVATRLVKPIGEYVVGPGEEQTVLAPLPIQFVPGVERDDLRRFRELNFVTVSQITALRLEHLQVFFDKRALFLYEAIRGIDSSPVFPIGKEPPIIRIDHEFGEDTNDMHVLEKTLYGMAERAGWKLRQQRLSARRVNLTLDHSDGIRRARWFSVKPATANDLTLFKSAREALSSAWSRRVRIRHMRLVCDRLVFPPAQLALFAENRKEKEKQDNLINAIDRIRDRFGRDAIKTGRTLAA